MQLKAIVVFVVALLASVSPTVSADAGKYKIAVLPFDIAVEKQVAIRPKASEAETKRLQLVTEKLTSLLSESDRYEVVDISGLSDEIKQAAPFFKCNGCDVEIGKKAGADRVATGKIQKSSETLINVSILIRDVATEELTNSMAVSIRQNTDAGWLRGVRWLVRNRLLNEDAR